MKRFNNVAIILYGPPGSGKGTQAKLLADKLGFFHFDTGEYLRKILHDPKRQKNKIIRKERKLNDSGKLNTPAWVLRIVSQRTKELNKLGQSIIFSGSPRTIYEAFGGGKNNGLIQILEKLYGKKNIYVFILFIPEKESIRRNSNRSICSVCGSPILNLKSLTLNLKDCPFCAGPVKRRRDDKKEVIIRRLKEYRERTLPIVKKLKKGRFRVVKIDGRPLPYKIHKRISSYFK